MPRVESKNVIMTVKDNEVDRYLDMGYNLIDEKGNIIKESVPRDLGKLQKAFVESKKRIAELESEIKALKAELDHMEPPHEQEDSADRKDSDEEKPKRGRKKQADGEDER